MDTVAEKISIIHRICEIQDDDLLTLVKNILETPHQSQNDWWDNLSDNEQTSINRGLADFQKGNLIEHEDVREKYEHWLHD